MKLKNKDQLLSKLLHNCPNSSVSILDHELRHILVEGKGPSRDDLSSEQLVGKTLAEIYPPESLAGLINFYQRALAGEDLEFEFTQADQTYQIHLAPLEEDHGQVTLILAVAQNITAYKREQAARMVAEEESRLKDEFLATVSHELKNPLNSILGWATLLRQGMLTSEAQQQAIDVIERNARTQSRLIEDLLDVSRIITGQLCISPEPADLFKIIKSARETLRHTAESKQIAIEIINTAQSSQMIGDPHRLQQVVWNLLSNAIKFSPTGSTVSIRLDQRGSQFVIQVVDSGQGIPHNFLPHIFDRLRQVETVTGRKHSGLGLGLVIVRHLVELHGGKVSVESEGENRGSTFTVNLPVAAIPREIEKSSGTDDSSGLNNGNAFLFR